MVGELFDMSARAHLDDMRQLADEMEGKRLQVPEDVRSAVRSDLKDAVSDFEKAYKRFSRHYSGGPWTPTSGRTGLKAVRSGTARLEKIAARQDVPQGMRAAFNDAIASAKELEAGKSFNRSTRVDAYYAANTVRNKVSTLKDDVEGQGFRAKRPAHADSAARLDTAIHALGAELEPFMGDMHPEARKHALDGLEKVFEATRTLNELAPSDSVPSKVSTQVREAVDLLERAAADSNRRDLSQTESLMQRLRAAGEQEDAA